MLYFVYHAHSDTATQPGMPSTDTIVQATRGDGVHSFLAGATAMRLVGPTPRIVRSTTLGSLTAGFHTDVAELIEVNAAPGYEANAQPAAQNLADIISQQLQASDSSWQRGTITPWNQATNGAVAWWGCTAGTSPTDCASVTMTRDGIQQGAARANPDENPIGPTTSASHPGSILPTLPSLPSMTGFLVAVGGLLGLYLLWPALSGARRAVVAKQRYSAYSAPKRYSLTPPKRPAPARANPSDHGRIQRLMREYVKIKYDGTREYVHNSAIPHAEGVWAYWTRPVEGGAPRREKVLHSTLVRTVTS